MNLLRKIAVVVVVMAVSSVAQADPIGYSIKRQDGENALWRFDLSVGTVERIGVIGEQRLFGGIAIDSQGRLYAATYMGALFEVNTLDASTSFIGNISSGPSSGNFLRGLDFSGDTLIGIDDMTSPNVFAVDVNTADRTEIVTAQGFLGNTISFAMHGANTALVYSNFWNFYSLDLISGSATIINNSVLPSHGMDFTEDNILYGVGSSYVGLSTIDPSSGTSLLVESNIGTSWNNLTIHGATSVPEPGTLALLGLGLAGIGVSRRRKR